jgi:four helix bundle suffix protein
MVQAARSGVQNIAEGSEASGTSKKTELKLTNVARASLEELRLDYEDYLRHRRLLKWPDEDPRRGALVRRRCTTAEQVAAWVKEQHEKHFRGNLMARDRSIQSMSSISSIKPTYSEIAANAALILIGVASALLDRQIEAQANAFTEEGGFTERLHRVRTSRRNEKKPWRSRAE